jgi:hypothetical protein
LSKVYFVVTVLYFNLWLLTKCFTCSQTLRWLCFLSFFVLSFWLCNKKKITFGIPWYFLHFLSAPWKVWCSIFWSTNVWNALYLFWIIHNMFTEERIWYEDFIILIIWRMDCNLLDAGRRLDHD